MKIHSSAAQCISKAMIMGVNCLSAARSFQLETVEMILEVKPKIIRAEVFCLCCQMKEV